MPSVRSTLNGSERVVVVLALVEDAAHPGPEEEVAVREDLVPQLLDGADLREEAVAAEVEAPTVALDGAADAAHDRVRFEHCRRDAGFADS